MKKLIKSIVILFLALILVIGSLVFSSTIIHLGFEPIKIIISIILIIVPSIIISLARKFIWSGIDEWFILKLTYFRLRLVIIGVLLSVFTWMIRDHHDVLYSMEYYWDGGVEVYFRDNDSYKIINIGNFMGASYSYGEYKLEKGKLILSPSIRLEMVEFNDTIYKSQDKFHFKLKNEWKGLLSDSTNIIYHH